LRRPIIASHVAISAGLKARGARSNFHWRDPVT